VIVNGLLLIGVYVMLIPFVFMVTSTFKPNSEIFAWPVRILPQSLFLENYDYLFAEYSYFRWYWNTIITTIIRVAISVFFSAMAGFALAKYNFRFKKVIFMLVIISLLLPFQILVVPLFLEMATFQWLDTYAGVIIPFAISPFYIFLMRQYMLGVPEELLDAARIDGASEFMIFWRVVAPIQRPAFAVVSILSFTAVWGDYFWPLVVLQSTDMFVLNVGIASMWGPYRVPYGAILAGSFLATLPVIIVFLVMQRQFIAGLTSGALKGVE
jgi:multiple sugar transport system permease protein/arabinosaccharide transport system permease protein